MYPQLAATAFVLKLLKLETECTFSSGETLLPVFKLGTSTYFPSKKIYKIKRKRNKIL
jgi:hypothetical protein